MSRKNQRKKVAIKGSWKSIIHRLLTGVFIAVIALSFAEIGLRLFSYEPKRGNPVNSFFGEKHYKLAKNESGELMYHTNPTFRRYFHTQKFPFKKRGAFRVFALGGSSTYGWGNDNPVRDGFLAEFQNKLRVLKKNLEVEVINAGGIGYGSFRVAALMREIVEYEPDLILIFSGHNEFWEYPIYMKIFGKDISLQKISQFFEKSLFYSFLRDMILLPLEKVISIPNLFEGNYEVFDEGKYDLVKKLYQRNLKGIIKLAKKKNIPIIFSTLPANLKVNPESKTDWLWDASHHLNKLSEDQLKKWKASYAKAWKEVGKSDFSLALAYFNKAQQTDPTFARIYYGKGVCYEELGDYSSAYDAYWTHIDLSRRLVVREFNDLIMKLCFEEKVPCIDGGKAFEEHSKNGLTNYDLFVDSMHPNEEGHKLLGKEFLLKFKQMETFESIGD